MSAGWELVTRWPGGTVTALAASGDNAQTLLAATAAGLHNSDDDGQSWRWIALGPSPIVQAMAVAPAPGRGKTMLLGTERGLHRSADGGQTWREVVSGGGVPALAVAPDFRDTGIAFAGTTADGLLRSDDGGLTWAGANAGLLDLSVTAVAISPTFGRDRTALVGTTGGLYRSRNGGRAWRLADLGTTSPMEAVAISPTFADDGLVLAGTESAGLFRSDDGGQRWQHVESLAARSVTTVAFAVRSGRLGTIAVGTGEGVAISDDGGASWRLVAAELGPALSLAFVGHGMDTALLAGTIGGVIRIAPDASTWTPANEGLAGRALVGLALAPDFATRPVLAVASLDGGVSISADAGASWMTSTISPDEIAVSSVGMVAGTILATTPSSLYRSRDLGVSWERIDLPVRSGQVFSSLSVATGSEAVVAAGGHMLALSLDGGETWQALPPPAEAGEVVGACCSPAVVRDRTVYAAARPKSLAADGGSHLDLWWSSDLGEHWTRWLDAPNARAMPLVVPPAAAGVPTILAGIPGGVGRPLAGAQERRGRERRPIWQAASTGPPGASVTALALSPRFNGDGIVVAAADRSVSISRDGSASFTAWDDDLDVPAVTGLGIAQTTDGGLAVYALGLGGTLWRRTVS